MSTALQLTLDEYDRMIEQGAFEGMRDKRIELINGELREMPPPGPTHAYVVSLLADWSASHAPRDRVLAWIQSPIAIPPSASAPEPDVAWVERKSYRRQRPLPEEVFLLIEVADSSVGDDRFVKGPLYAEAEIAEYWIVNIPARCIEVHRDPEKGSYRDIRSYGIDETVRPLAFPELELPVETLFVG